MNFLIHIPTINFLQQFFLAQAQISTLKISIEYRQKFISCFFVLKMIP